MKSVKPFKSQGKIKIVYFGCFHSSINYRSTSWGKSSHSAKILKIQHKIIRIITGCRLAESRRDSFKNVSILPL